MPHLSLIFETDKNKDQRRFNAPVSNEIAFIFKNANGEPPFSRDLLTYPKSLYIPLRSDYNTIRIGSQMNVCDPMTYTLLFPWGDLGWNSNIMQIGIIIFLKKFIYI